MKVKRPPHARPDARGGARPDRPGGAATGGCAGRATRVLAGQRARPEASATGEREWMPRGVRRPGRQGARSGRAPPHRQKRPQKRTPGRYRPHGRAARARCSGRLVRVRRAGCSQASQLGRVPAASSGSTSRRKKGSRPCREPSGPAGRPHRLALKRGAAPALARRPGAL